MHRKRIAFLMLLIIFLAACSPGTDGNGADLFAKDKVYPCAGWNISLLSFETVDRLEGSELAVQYGGDTIQVTNHNEPADGMAFAMVELLVQKTPDAILPFQWSGVSIETEDGTRFNRVENDTFLTNYNIPRIKSIDLTFGENSGVACYEIPKDLKGDLFFVCRIGEDEVRIKIK